MDAALLLSVFVAHGFWDLLDVGCSRRAATYLVVLGSALLLGVAAPTLLSFVFLAGSLLHLRHDLGSFASVSLLVNWALYPGSWAAALLLPVRLAGAVLSAGAAVAVALCNSQGTVSAVVAGLIGTLPPLELASAVLGSHFTTATASELRSDRWMTSAAVLLVGAAAVREGLRRTPIRQWLGRRTVMAVLLAHMILHA